MNSTALTRARSLSVFRALLFVLAVVGAAHGHPQNKTPSTISESDAVIAVDVRLVILHATVRNKNGGIVSGLKERNFKVEEDGKPQTIRDVRSEDIPVAVGLVVDNSASMRRKLVDVASAAVAFARAGNPDDEMFVVNFNEHVSLGLAETMSFSASARDLENAIRTPLPPGRTALYDAVTAGLTHLRKSSRERKVLVVMSDGGDNASKSTLDQVLQDIWRSDVAIYTIGLFDQDNEERNNRVLQRIASASGGASYFPAVARQATDICQQIAQDIRTQYTLAYSPSNQEFNGRLRRITVRAVGAHGENLRVRARTGYIASAAPAEVQR